MSADLHRLPERSGEEWPAQTEHPIPRYAELATASHYSFLRGASHPGDLVGRAIYLRQAGIGIADRNTVAGVVRAYDALNRMREDGILPPQKVREGSGPGEYAWRWSGEVASLETEEVKRRAADFKLVVGSRLVFTDGTPDILAYPQDRDAWGRLCRLLTLGNRRAKKGECILTLDDLLGHARGLLLVAMPGRRLEEIEGLLPRLNEVAPEAVWLAATMHRQGHDRRRLVRLKGVADAAGVPLLAANDVLYHRPEQRALQDVVTCIREGVTIATAGRRLEANGERHLKPPEEMARLFQDVPEAITETSYVLDRIDFSLAELKHDYPEEPVPVGKTPQSWLEELTWRRADLCYPEGIPDKVRGILVKELKLIAKLDYARYFLTIYDIVRVANDKKILCQGRGSAANSAVCFVLGITAVNPADIDVLFERFLSEERKEPPDIDVDFEHERREEIIQHIYERYGRERAGIAATVICYRPRSAIREVGKVFGLTEDVTARLAGTVWGSWGSDIADQHVSNVGLDAGNPVLRQALDLAAQLIGSPRHLSQHVGGFVLTRTRLDEVVPIGNAAMPDRTFVEWDKDDLDALGLLKVDVLGLGMLTCIRKGFDLIQDHWGQEWRLATVPREDQAVYAMLQKGDSIGVFQVESRAQINMLPRLRPENFYDLVIEVAIVRPGPIQGDMVHPYLRRRNKEEKVEFPSPAPDQGHPDELRQILGKTLGVPLFQEQAMRIAMEAAKFSPEEANRLRRAMATFRHNGTIHKFEAMMVERMAARGYDRAFAERCFNQIKGFGEYGFPESHAASFAKLVYISAWLKCFYPAAFACALLNSQPMGFYAPAQIVRDAQEHGVEARAADINFSRFDCTLEPDEQGAFALRLGFRQITGFREDWANALVDRRETGFDSVETLRHRGAMPLPALKLLADADAFRSIGLDRRAALWAVRRLPDDSPLPLFAAADARDLGAEEDVALPAMADSEHVVADYQMTRLSLKAHPMAFLRGMFRTERVSTCAEIGRKHDGARGRVAGIVLVRQRPGKGNAIFMTLEDETGVTNIVIWARMFEAFRAEVMGARLAMVEGRVQKSPEGVIHLMAERVVDRSDELIRLLEGNVHLTEVPQGMSHPRNVRIIPRSRDFH